MKSTHDIVNSLFDPRSSGMIIMQYIELPKDEIERRFIPVLEKIKGLNHITYLRPTYIFRDVDIDTYTSMLYSAWFNKSFTIHHVVDEYEFKSDDYKNKDWFNYFTHQFSLEKYHDHHLNKRMIRNIGGSRYKLLYRHSLLNLLYDRFNFMMENQGEDNIMIYKYNTVEERMRNHLLSLTNLPTLHKILDHREINGMSNQSREEIVNVLVNEIEVGKDCNIIVKRK